MPYDLATVDSGATAWVLASSALVLLMTPGLALFYGGMVRAKNVLGILMQGFTTIAVVTVTWTLVGFTLAFSGGTPVVGDLHFAGLANLAEQVPGYSGSSAMVVPPVVFVVFQLTFAVITPAIVLGATADRWRFGAFLPFVALWSLLVYAPVAHWVFSPTGWAARWGALDFAGGTVVHVNAGAAALAMALVLGRRRGWPQDPMRPHSLPLVLVGTALLWFGWLGFNGGSALGATGVAGFAVLNTNIAAAAALLSWVGVERIRYGKPTTLGAASGAVAGLVAVTPCAGFVGPMGALAVGAVAGAACALVVTLKAWVGVDDSLDVVAVHLGAGVIGSVCVGLFATRSVNPAGADGLFYGGEYVQLARQVVVVLVVAAYSFTVTWLIGTLLERILGNRVTARQEALGLDLALHGEGAYETGVPAAAQPVPPATSPPAVRR